MNWDVDTPEGLANATAWMRPFLDRLADGAIWHVPRSGSIIQIHKSKKRAVRLFGLAPETSIQKVFEAMGWTWEDRV